MLLVMSPVFWRRLDSSLVAIIHSALFGYGLTLLIEGSLKAVACSAVVKADVLLRAFETEGLLRL